MNGSAKLLYPACLTMLVAAGFNTSSAAEGQAPTQVLVQVDIPDQVMAAHWMRLPDAYVLRVVLDQPQPQPAYVARTDSATTDKPPPMEVIGGDGSANRASYFIANTIEKLRYLNPTFGCRTLTLVDGRRVADGPRVVREPQRAPAQPDQPYTFLHQGSPPMYKDPRVDIWLLKADGSQILGATYSCEYARVDPANPRRHLEVSYEFPLASAEQAVAAAIRIDDRYFIEKLQQTAPEPAAL